MRVRAWRDVGDTKMFQGSSGVCQVNANRSVSDVIDTAPITPSPLVT